MASTNKWQVFVKYTWHSWLDLGFSVSRELHSFWSDPKMQFSYSAFQVFLWLLEENSLINLYFFSKSEYLYGDRYRGYELGTIPVFEIFRLYFTKSVLIA